MQPASSNVPFGDAYREAAPAVFAWVGVHLGPGLRSELDPEDVLQEVACRAFARQADYDPARGPFRAWLFGIARKVLFQSLERMTGSGRPDREWLTTGGLSRVPEEATSVTRRVARDDAQRRFLALVDELTEEERTLVLQRGLEGLAHEEIAQALGIEAATAAKRWGRLVPRLREKLGAEASWLDTR